MKQVLVFALGVFCLTGRATAGACVSGTLSSYIALGATGCTIGGETLSNFTILSGTTGATPIGSTNVTLTPTGSLYSPGVAISTSQTANGSLLESIFTYKLSGLPMVGSSLLLSGSSESGGGAVTGLENFCAGGMFGPDGVSGCTGFAGSLTTLDGIQQMDNSPFSQVSFVNITDDFTIDGSFGSASGGTLKNSFAAVPEPLSTSLFGVGFALLAAMRFRKRN